MTTNHPAHGPVSLDRLHQIREILSKAAAQSDGGNLGYAMADAVKVIDVAIAEFGAEPVLYAAEETLAYAKMGELHLKCLSQPMGDAVIPLYLHAQSEPVSVPDGIDKWQAIDDIRDHDESFRWDSADGYEAGWNACRAAMLQAGNSPVISDALVNHENDKTERLAYSVNEFGFFSARKGSKDEISVECKFFDFGRGNIPKHKVNEYAEKFMLQGVINKLQEAVDIMSDELIIDADGKSAFHRAPTTDTWIPVSERMPEGSEEVLCTKEFDGPGDWRKKVGYWHAGKWTVYGASWTPTHWMPLPAAPQQEVNRG